MCVTMCNTNLLRVALPPSRVVTPVSVSVSASQEKKKSTYGMYPPPLPSTPWQAAPRNGLNPTVRTHHPAHGSSRGLSSRVGLPSCTVSPRTRALNSEIRSHRRFAC